MPSDRQIQARIQEIVHPATLAQVSYFHRLGLRERSLGFVVMVAFVLKMIWRQIGSVSALTRAIQKEAILWEQPKKGSQQAMSQRLTSLPEKIWYERDPKAHDQRFWPDILSVLKAGSLLILDKGYINFSIFIKLTQAKVKFITRGKTNLAYTLERAIVRTAAVHDYLVWIGKDETRQQIRLIEVQYLGKWYRYMTNELDAERLPTAYVVALYWQRWLIEDAYNIAKRLSGLAYFWCGAQNAVEMQVWATWLLYVVLIDLTDAVAETLNKPFAAILIEMVYRSLYFL